MENLSADDKLVTDFTDGISKADDLRSEGLENAAAILSCNYNALSQQREWLAAKHGSDHTLTKRAGNELLFWSEFSEVIDAEISQSKIKPGTFKLTDWRVHGRVFDKTNMPVKEVGISLGEINKGESIVIHPAKTDENGYYSITLDEKVVKELNGKSMDLSLSNNKRKIPAGVPVLIPAPGNIEYRDIYI